MKKKNVVQNNIKKKNKLNKIKYLKIDLNFKKKN